MEEGKDNILFCSAGRRVSLLNDFRKGMNGCGKIIACNCSPFAPALTVADEAFIVPEVLSPNYFEKIFEICANCDVKAITTLIDVEIERLAEKRNDFVSLGILPLCPSAWTARLCFNKYEMFKFMKNKGIRTILTYDSLEHFKEGLDIGEIHFPVFLKPITGSGSLGTERANTWQDVERKFNDGTYKYIIQELMTGDDCDVDFYVDCISHKPVSIFGKKKIEKRIGGATQTISFKDKKLFDFVEQVCTLLDFNGPCNMDFFITNNGEYCLSEINPRFGGSYLHAYEAGIDFVQLILNNMHGIENKRIIGQYEEDTIMMMYDSVVITKKNQLLK